jgi:hypothetical protein
MSLSSLYVVDAVGHADEDIVIQFARAGKEAEIAAMSLKREEHPNVIIMSPFGAMKQPSQRDESRTRWQFGMRFTAEEYESLGCPGVGALFILSFLLTPKAIPI